MFLNLIVTGEELWYHYHIPTSKQSSLTWKHKNSFCTIKTRSKTSAEKVMQTLFLEISGPVLVEWMSKNTINAARYVNILHEVEYKYQKSLERKIKRSNCVVAQQHETPYSGTDTVDVDNTEIQSSHVSTVQPRS